MQTYIALLRGINVGGHHKLPMKELRTLLENLGLQNVKTYIASGNVVFQCQDDNTADLAARIGAEIEKDYGFNPQIMLLEQADVETAVQANPFPEATAEPKSLHFFFLFDAPENPNLAALEELKKGNERFELKDKVFYLHTPDGIGRSELAEKLGRHLGVSMTARNWRTVDKLIEMVREVE